MFTVSINKERTIISTNGEKTVVLAEALCCVDACRDFLAKNMNLTKEKANAMIAESLTE